MPGRHSIADRSFGILWARTSHLAKGKERNHPQLVDVGRVLGARCKGRPDSAVKDVLKAGAKASVHSSQDTGRTDLEMVRDMP
jgi:hypothetical protein